MSRDQDAVYATAGLVDALLELAADADPQSVTIALAATPASDLDPAPDPDREQGQDRDRAGDRRERGQRDASARGGPAAPVALADVPGDAAVFTDLYVPEASRSVSAVFGMDLGVPPGQTAGRFLSHPTGELDVDLTDHLHKRMLVAAPTWSRENVAAFDRSGRRLTLVVVDAVPPEGTLES